MTFETRITAANTTYLITRKCENHYHNRWSNSIEYPYSVNLTPGYALRNVLANENFL